MNLLMQKVEKLMSVAVVAALLLLTSIGFAQTKTPAKKVVNKKENVQEKVVTKPTEEMQPKKEVPTQTVGVGFEIAESVDEAAKVYTPLNSFIIPTAVYIKNQSIFENSKKIETVVLSNELMMLYEVQLDNEQFINVIKLMRKNRLTEKPFCTEVLPKLMVTGDEASDIKNYGAAITTYLKFNEYVTNFAPQMILELQSNPENLSKLYRMQLEYGNFIKKTS